MLVGFNNYVDADGCVLAGGAWQIALSKLQDAVVTDVARSADLNLSSTKFTIDLGVSRSFRFFALTHTNLSSAALYKFTWYSDAFTTVAGSTGWTAMRGYWSEDPDGVGAAIFHVFDDDVSARYAKLELDDNGNTDGYVDAGRFFIPEELGLGRNPDNGVTDDGEPNTPRLNALGGTGHFNRRKSPRLLSAVYSYLSEAEAASIRRMRRICNLDKQLVVIPAPWDTDHLMERSFIANLKSWPKLALQSAGYTDAQGLDFLEVV